MDTIKYGDHTDAVGIVQDALIRRGFLPRLTATGRPNKDNRFGPLTSEAVLKFQLEMVRLGFLKPDEATGRTCGPRCLALLLEENPAVPTETPDWPERPDFSPLDEAGMETLFGSFSYTPRKARTTNGERITVTDRWAEENLITVHIPQLVGVPFYYPDNPDRCKGRVTLHKLAAPRFIEFLHLVEKNGMLPLIRTYDGAYNPRFQRGSTTKLSTHAFATSMDFNAYANPLGREPASMGQDGCLLPLVGIASSLGIYWGGFFPRKDGMHFEVAQL